MPVIPSSSRSDPLRPLRAFAQVTRLGSVSRAAEALGISQPAVTQQLQALAREHGVELLERSGRRLVPTAAGEALLALARPLVDGVDGLAEALQAQLRARAPDSLSVAAGSVALRHLMPGAMAALADGPALQVLHAGGAAALDLVRDGSVAVAVGSWLDPPGDVTLLPLLASPARLLLPRAHPLAALERPGPADLSGHGLVLPRHRRTTRQLVDLACGRAGVPFQVSRETGDWPSAIELVALDQGITVSTALAVDHLDDPRIAIRPLSDRFPARPYAIAMRRGRTPGNHAERFIDALRDAASALETRFSQ